MKYTTPMTMLAITFGLLFASGCDRQAAERSTADGASSTTAASGPSEPGTRPESAPASKPNQWTFAGPPHPEQGPLRATLDLEVALRERCEPSARQVGTFQLKSGEEVAWDAAMTVVKHPYDVRARRDTNLSLAPVSKNRKAADAEIDLTVPAGRAVGLLKDAGGGSCYVVIESMIGITKCPDTRGFEADGWTGVRLWGDHRWCVRPTGEKGWLIVDEDQLASD